jgi:hypothetical protein
MNTLSAFMGLLHVAEVLEKHGDNFFQMVKTLCYPDYGTLQFDHFYKSLYCEERKLAGLDLSRKYSEQSQHSYYEESKLVDYSKIAYQMNSKEPAGSPRHLSDDPYFSPDQYTCPAFDKTANQEEKQQCQADSNCCCYATHDSPLFIPEEKSSSSGKYSGFDSSEGNDFEDIDEVNSFCGEAAYDALVAQPSVYKGSRVRPTGQDAKTHRRRGRQEDRWVGGPPTYTNCQCPYEAGESFLESPTENCGCDTSGECHLETSGRRKRMHKSKASHNIVEKNRRAHLKSCFEVLKHNIPSLNGHKASTVNILQEAYTYIKQLEETTENRNGRIMALKEQQTTLMARLKSHYEAGGKELEIVTKKDIFFSRRSEAEKDQPKHTDYKQQLRAEHSFKAEKGPINETRQTPERAAHAEKPIHESENLLGSAKRLKNTPKRSNLKINEKCMKTEGSNDVLSVLESSKGVDEVQSILNGIRKNPPKIIFPKLQVVT